MPVPEAHSPNGMQEAATQLAVGGVGATNRRAKRVMISRRTSLRISGMPLFAGANFTPRHFKLFLYTSPPDTFRRMVPERLLPHSRPLDPRPVQLHHRAVLLPKFSATISPNLRQLHRSLLYRRLPQASTQPNPHQPPFLHHLTARKMSAAADSSVELVEAAKRKAAQRAVAEHFRTDMRFVGIGSGSTIVYGVEAIRDVLAARPADQKAHSPWFIPTGWASRKVIEGAGLNCIAFDSLPANSTLDVAFDGADEVDDELNCVKGGGACLFQEKLVARRAKKFVCIADYRKEQSRLLTSWPTVPIEVAPIAHATVAAELKRLGSPAPVLREHTLAKAGPIQTDQSFYIIDAPFKKLLTDSDVAAGADGSGKDGVWHVDALAARIKAIVGVLEVGLFCGPNGIEAQELGLTGGEKPVAVYFGLANGDTKVRTYEDVKKAQ